MTDGHADILKFLEKFFGIQELIAESQFSFQTYLKNLALGGFKVKKPQNEPGFVTELSHKVFEKKTGDQFRDIQGQVLKIRAQCTEIDDLK